MSLNQIVRTRTSETCIWGTNEFKKGYQPRTNLGNDEKGDLLADPHKIVNRWMNYFCQLLNVQRVEGISRQKYRQQSHLCQSLIISEVEVAIG
jgi:hypothetical protein